MMHAVVSIPLTTHPLPWTEIIRSLVRGPTIFIIISTLKVILLHTVCWGSRKNSNKDDCAGQESWEKEESKVSVDGTNGSGSLGESRRGEGGEEFLVKGCLACRVELIKDVNYEKVCGI